MPDRLAGRYNDDSDAEAFGASGPLAHDFGRASGTRFAMTEPEPSAAVIPAHLDHTRSFRDNTYVYSVVSRRSRGVSIGVNLNPDKICNFDCIYCQVDRKTAAVTRFVDVEMILSELTVMIDMVETAKLFDEPEFRDVPEPLRRLNDIAFSGDGEPTTARDFDVIVRKVADLKKAKGLDHVKMVLITNATMFHRPKVKDALTTFDANNGEIWAKLDAGTEPFYKQIDKSLIPFSRVLTNIRDAALLRPLVIQTLFMNVDGQAPSDDEIDAYCARLQEILDDGGKIDRIQLYTVARKPPVDYVTPLPREVLDRIADRVAARMPVPVERFYGPDTNERHCEPA
jgi:wyosine [tRNA(Phe)-imidazoG37] synthetase (radical SAM superfamily)